MAPTSLRRNLYTTLKYSRKIYKSICLTFYPGVNKLSLIRLVASAVLGILIVFLSLYFLEPPLGMALGVVISGLLIGILTTRPRNAFVIGLLSGLIGFFAAYGAGGGGSLGFAVYRELLGSIGLILPPIYYMLSCGIIAVAIAIITQALKTKGGS
jgi:hypothetical protein